jgi:YidB-like protein
MNASARLIDFSRSYAILDCGFLGQSKISPECADAVRISQWDASHQRGAIVSWIGGEHGVALAKVLSADPINALMAHTGLSRDDLLNGLSQHLPEVVDKMTPNGHVPTPDEVQRLL